MKYESNYNKCLNTIFGFQRFGIKLGLDTIANVLKNLNNPHQNYKSIHIAGTNGKGSIASYLCQILTLSGYKVGLYTSPHLVSFNERITINNQPISNNEVVSAYNAVSEAYRGDRNLTFFEFATAMAFYNFNINKVDWAIIETGMGGRLDATNVLIPEISIISNISCEHKMYLGNTLEKIAKEKAGIIKKNIPVVTGAKQNIVKKTFIKKAKTLSCPIFLYKKSFKIIRNNKNNTFSYYGMDNIWKNLKTGLKGNYQLDNAAVTLAACEVLIKKKYNISYENIKKGLETTKWQGRLEVVKQNPTVLLDGAHNLDAARNLAKYLKVNFFGKKIILVIGILDDKPYKEMLKLILPCCRQVILTRPENERGLDPKKLYEFSKTIISDSIVISDIKKALQHALKIASKDDVICVAGSLYVVGEAKQYL